MHRVDVAFQYVFLLSVSFHVYVCMFYIIVLIRYMVCLEFGFFILIVCSACYVFMIRLFKHSHSRLRCCLSLLYPLTFLHIFYSFKSL